MNSKYLLYPLLLLSLSGCTDQSAKMTTPVIQKETKPVLMQPFKYHKAIEVSPGNFYDVFSWGRGADGGGQYMILRSDSSDQQYNTINGDLEGPIKEVLNADMDVDGNPEIIIYANSIDTNRYTNVFVYEYNNDNARKIDFPRLTDSQRKGYRGGDDFYIKESKLMREFPIYNGRGKEALPSGAKRVIQYSLQSNSLYGKQISKDSTSTSQVAEKRPEPAVVKHSSTSSKSKKRATISKKHKVVKKARRHRR
ncbi:hypothetical protein [Mucilaginibacter ginkgonis]|uniref:Uncharacterized protein n=1 Tax=Mucilaginibacter ginkgonis TaxID=2682091 RepID=A0A6I4HVT6_9SPHI|nr:hypothetical protein [Mucilaginibacter ginkgonis]QQL51053.1 hypothetical protein GO620_006275 [Mucilaginibacter ginkgonis]